VGNGEEDEGQFFEKVANSGRVVEERGDRGTKLPEPEGRPIA